MIWWRDKHGRNLVLKTHLRDGWKLSVFGVFLHLDRYSVHIGYKPGWLSSQPKLVQCLKCNAFVGSACETVDNPNGYYENGPWSFWCRDYYNPLPGDIPPPPRRPFLMSYIR
jgi:hypothetical protein